VSPGSPKVNDVTEVIGAAGPPVFGVRVLARNHCPVLGRKTPTRSEPSVFDQPQAPTSPWSPGRPNATEVAAAIDESPGSAR
jgi:hypothetical protein